LIHDLAIIGQRPYHFKVCGHLLQSLDDCGVISGAYALHNASAGSLLRL
jgi:hypothetical protein